MNDEHEVSENGKTPPHRGNRLAGLLESISIDRRFMTLVLITLILLAAHFSFGILESYEKTLLAIGVSFAAEIVFSLTILRKWPHLGSAYMSGISIGILLRSPFLWPYALAALITITSKYALRVRGRHIWNPSNFAFAAMFFLAPFAAVPLSVQWGNNIWPMLLIWIIGSITIWKLKRFHICAAYVLGFVVFALIRSWITGDPFLVELAPITGPMYQLFIFFMITDPKTTVRSKKGQAGVAFLVAFVEFFFRLGESVSAPFYALFFVGPIALLYEIYRSPSDD
jgi:enediyne biosynthesis protein E5